MNKPLVSSKPNRLNVLYIGECSKPLPFSATLNMLCTLPTRVNSRLVIDAVTTAITADNALTLLSGYDIILDCTDNVPTRYLLSDTAVALGKPLVSGAAQKFDGQLCVYNLGEFGPCYRCIFPVPPSPSNVGSCEELGILGAVTGIIGNMQALETIKMLTGLHGTYLLPVFSSPLFGFVS